MYKSLGRLTYETVRVVHTVLRVKNLTNVANELGISQPAVTFHVKKFETIVGRRILGRIGNSLVAKPDEEKIISLCERILSSYNELKLISRSYIDRRKTIGISQDAFSAIVLRSSMLFQYIDKYKFIVDHPSVLVDRFQAGELQGYYRAIDYDEPLPELCTPHKFYFVVRSDMAQILNGADPIPMLVDGSTSILARMAMRYLEGKGIKYSVLAELSDCESLKRFLTLGVGCALVPGFLLGNVADTGSRLIEIANLQGGVAFFHHKRELPFIEASSVFDLINSALGIDSEDHVP